MRELHIDLECFSSADLARTGVYKYVQAEDFEILLFGYSVDGGEVTVIDLASGEKMPEAIIEALSDPGITKYAHNSSFERICLSRWLTLHGYSLNNDTYSIPEDHVRDYLDPSSWRCTMVWSAYLGLPLSLAGVGTVLGLEKQKLEEGKDLIRYFCKPCTPTSANGMRTRNLPTDAPDKWSVFKAYNKRDVETEMEIQQRLINYPVPDFVWDQYHQDQEINDRGIAVDMTLVNSAIAMDALSHDELTRKMQELTNLDNPGSVTQMKRWLAENGMEAESLGKKEVSAMLKDAPKPLGDVLVLRQQLAKSSVKKYQAIEACVCADGRVRGMFQFYGAARTGRFSGRLVQLQNLVKNELNDLNVARELVRFGDYEAVEQLYGDVPDTLSQLIRTAFVAPDGKLFYVADFSAIEARVIAWLAGEQWRMDLFRRGGDIYCQSASQMFKVPVEKHGINGHLRQKGKIAELACIAEDSLVLTDHGLIPIQRVTTDMRVWDGESWVQHGGVVERGEREVITYEGLTATPDHPVWVKGQSKPLPFAVAAACGAHLVQSGDGRKEIRLGQDHFSTETLESGLESLLCSDAMQWLWNGQLAGCEQSDLRHFKRVPALFTSAPDSCLASQTPDRSKTALRKSCESRVSELWRQRDPVRIYERHGSRAVSDWAVWTTEAVYGNRPHRYERKLCPRKSPIRIAQNELCESTSECVVGVRSEILAICPFRCCSVTIERYEPGGNHTGCRTGSDRKEEKLARNTTKAHVYDIRNAGPHHRFTVSGRLVHNCGYGGSVGALKAMGALEMGLQEDELYPLVKAWRESNPNIVKLWWDVDTAAMEAVSNKTAVTTHGIRFVCKNGMLFITLPSGRNLSYVKPMIGTNKFGSPAITYLGVGGTKRWERLETYGPKLVENIVQGFSRDVLCYAMNTLRYCFICGHVHDEVIIEADPKVSLETICEQMGRTPPWAEGLILRADGYTTPHYKKD